MTLALHPGYDTTEADKKIMDKEVKEMAKAAGVAEEEIIELNTAVRTIYRNVKNLMTESKMSMIRQDAHNKEVDYNYS